MQSHTIRQDKNYPWEFLDTILDDFLKFQGLMIPRFFFQLFHQEPRLNLKITNYRFEEGNQEKRMVIVIIVECNLFQ